MVNHFKVDFVGTEEHTICQNLELSGAIYPDAIIRNISASSKKKWRQLWKGLCILSLELPEVHLSLTEKQWAAQGKACDCHLKALLYSSK